MSSQRDCPEHPGNRDAYCQPCKNGAARMPADFWERVDQAREQARIQRGFDREQGKSYL